MKVSVSVNMSFKDQDQCVYTRGIAAISSMQNTFFCLWVLFLMAMASALNYCNLVW